MRAWRLSISLTRLVTFVAPGPRLENLAKLCLVTTILGIQSMVVVVIPCSGNQLSSGTERSSARSELLDIIYVAGKKACCASHKEERIEIQLHNLGGINLVVNVQRYADTRKGDLLILFK